MLESVKSGFILTCDRCNAVLHAADKYGVGGVMTQAYHGDGCGARRWMVPRFTIARDANQMSG